MTHAWCSDPSRDEAVRAAEDGRTSPLPTLEECIETAFSAGVRDSFRKVGEAWAMIPKSVSASSPVDQENKGDGMRTERVTLEITHGESFGVSHWSWVTILRIKSGESVRVVEVPVGSVDDRAYADSMACDEERDFANRILAERDAAIRERDRWCAQSVVHERAANAAQARVAEMEAQLKILDDGQPTAPSDLGIWGTAKELSARCQELAARLVCVSTRATAAEARVAELEAASGGGERAVANVTFHVDDSAERARYVGMTVKPLRRPQPLGWLTGEEREAITLAAAQAPESDFVTNEEGRHLRAVLTALLARSTPPGPEGDG